MVLRYFKTPSWLAAEAALDAFISEMEAKYDRWDLVRRGAENVLTPDELGRLDGLQAAVDAEQEKARLAAEEYVARVKADPTYFIHPPAGERT